jgi:hypothetical protein
MYLEQHRDWIKHASREWACLPDVWAHWTLSVFNSGKSAQEGGGKGKQKERKQLFTARSLNSFLLTFCRWAKGTLPGIGPHLFPAYVLVRLNVSASRTLLTAPLEVASAWMPTVHDVEHLHAVVPFFAWKFITNAVFRVADIDPMNRAPTMKREGVMVSPCVLNMATMLWNTGMASYMSKHIRAIEEWRKAYNSTKRKKEYIPTDSDSKSVRSGAEAALYIHAQQADNKGRRRMQKVTTIQPQEWSAWRCIVDMVPDVVQRERYIRDLPVVFALHPEALVGVDASFSMTRERLATCVRDVKWRDMEEEFKGIDMQEWHTGESVWAAVHAHPSSSDHNTPRPSRSKSATRQRSVSSKPSASQQSRDTEERPAKRRAAKRRPPNADMMSMPPPSPSPRRAMPVARGRPKSRTTSSTSASSSSRRKRSTSSTSVSSASRAKQGGVKDAAKKRGRRGRGGGGGRMDSPPPRSSNTGRLNTRNSMIVKLSSQCTEYGYVDPYFQKWVSKMNKHILPAIKMASEAMRRDKGKRKRKRRVRRCGGGGGGKHRDVSMSRDRSMTTSNKKDTSTTSTTSMSSLQSQDSRRCMFGMIEDVAQIVSRSSRSVSAHRDDTKAPGQVFPATATTTIQNVSSSVSPQHVPQQHRMAIFGPSASSSSRSPSVPFHRRASRMMMEV